MNKITWNREKLWQGCVLASIAHAINVAHYPEFVHEQSWDGFNYSVQDSSGTRGTITFHPSYLAIRELAKQVGMNECKLKKGFRERFGMTIFELVRQKRMEKALWYMEVERLNVGETAVSVGYSNASNFTTTFRKLHGCNPSEYLKRIDQLDLERHRLQNSLE